jgi:hypothetical protein
MSAHFLYVSDVFIYLPFVLAARNKYVAIWDVSISYFKAFVKNQTYKESLDFRPLLSPDFLIYTALCGRNPETKAVANAPTVPKFLSGPSLTILNHRKPNTQMLLTLSSQLARPPKI